MVEFNIQHIKNNLDFYETIFSEENETAREFKSLSHPRKLMEELESWNRLLRNINKELFSSCSHDFIDDSIDIDMDRSQNIRYCRYCNLSGYEEDLNDMCESLSDDTFSG